MTSLSPPKPCPGCGRCRQACWIMSCLYLQTLVDKSDDRDPAKPSRALRAWIKLGGGRVSIRRAA